MSGLRSVEAYVEGEAVVVFRSTPLRISIASCLQHLTFFLHFLDLIKLVVPSKVSGNSATVQHMDESLSLST